MNVNKKNILEFSKKLLNIEQPPVLSSITMDGNCFFQSVHYAHTGKLDPYMYLRQKIAKTMTPPISGVSYDEFIHSVNLPYAELDVIIATSKYYNKPIVVISMNKYGGVTMIRPKNIKINLNNVLFLICINTIHYVPFHSKKVKITEEMRERLRQIENNKISIGSIQDEDDVYVTSFLLNELDPAPLEITQIKNSLSITRKHYKKKNKTFRL